MNKKLLESVKAKCKDTGLSEKYLTAITEKMGGSVEDDSTDDEAIETAANLIAEVAKDAQSEATRWANKKKDPEPKVDPKAEPKNEPKNEPKTDPDDDSDKKRIKELEDKVNKFETDRLKRERSKAIADAMEKHNIPKKFRERLAKSISDEDDVEEAVSAMKQDFITDGLMKEDKSPKVASEKQVDEAADSLLESITAKD